jgi:hypothetical protein
MLPDSNADEPGSHGFVTFSVKLKPGFSTGMFVRNKASIYFDFNEPVVTNETSSSIFVSVDPREENQTLRVYPNPASDRLIFESDNPGPEGDFRVFLFSATGSLLRSGGFSAGGTAARGELEVGDLAPGIYLLKWQDNHSQGTSKVVIIH